MKKILILSGILLLVCVSAFGATMGERNALASAKQYLSVMSFSYSGLMEQLEQFDEYSHAEAEYAVKNCGADWNEQAARKVTEYLKVMPMSRKGMIEQLTQFDGFTREQAVYGVDQSYK